MTNTPIYGYRKDSEDNNKWLIDEEAAPIVRRIYQMTIEGKGPYQIARILTDEKITRPSVRVAELSGKYSSIHEKEPHNWGGCTVKHILNQPEYMGHTINFRTIKESYKNNKHKYRSKDEWEVFENTQEAIIDEETWNTAQRCRKVKRRENKSGETNPLTGLIYCADCGTRMYNHRGTNADKWASHDGYRCPHSAKYPKNCSMHYITTTALRSLILNVIQTVSGYVRENEDEFIRQIRETSVSQQELTVKENKKLLAKSQKRHDELDVLFQKVYEDKINGSLSEKRFITLSQNYEKEQADLELLIEDLQSGLEQYEEDSDKADKFVALVRKYTDFADLTPAMLNEFVEKVIVHEGEKIDGNRRRRSQKVEIYLNFIGVFQVPDSEIEAEEPFDPAEHRKAQFRNYYYRHRNEILAKKKEQRDEQKLQKAQ